MYRKIRTFRSKISTRRCKTALNRNSYMIDKSKIVSQCNNQFVSRIYIQNSGIQIGFASSTAKETI